MNISPLARTLLWPFSLLYGLHAQLRAWLYAHGWLSQKRLPATVVSVGNLTVGGTGKTPMVLWLAEKFLEEGKRVAILSRGYRGTDGTSDEVEVMKHRLKTRVAFGVGRDRFAEGQRLMTEQPIDIFLLDDGFQHFQLARDLDIVLIDASRQLGHQILLPAGTMRERLTALDRADLVVFTRTESVAGAQEALQKLCKFPLFAATTRLLGFRLLGGDESLQCLGAIGSGPFFAFCGIGNPEAFFSDLHEWGVPVAGQLAFADHHRYTPVEARALEQLAEKCGAKAFVTTEKDLYNLAKARPQKLPVYIAVIDFVLRREDELMAAIKGTLQSTRGAAA